MASALPQGHISLAQAPRLVNINTVSYLRMRPFPTSRLTRAQATQTRLCKCVQQ